MGFDLAHAIGNVPLALHDSGADFAVWCSYKYLNAGPGAVGGCFVHRRRGRARESAAPRGLVGPRSRSGASSWSASSRRCRGAEGWQLSNPPILSLAPLAASLALFEEAGLAAPAAQVRAARRATSSGCSTRELGERARLLTPTDPEAARLPARRAARCRRRRRAASFAARLRAAGVVADWREPNVLRLAPVPLYNRFRDVYGAVQALRRTLDA